MLAPLTGESRRLILKQITEHSNHRQKRFHIHDLYGSSVPHCSTRPLMARGPRARAPLHSYTRLQCPLPATKPQSTSVYIKCRCRASDERRGAPLLKLLHVEPYCRKHTVMCRYTHYERRIITKAFTLLRSVDQRIPYDRPATICWRASTGR